MSDYIPGMVKVVGAAVYGRPSQSTRLSYKRPLPATPSTSPDKLDLERDSNPDGELGRDNDETLRRNNDGELSRSYDGKCTRENGGEASEESVLSLMKSNRSLRRQLKTAVTENDKHMLEINSIKKDLHQERSEKAATERDMQTMKKEALSLKERNSHLESELKKVQGTLDYVTMGLRKAQLSLFKQAQTEWFVEEDSEIRHALTQLYKDVRYWAKEYGIKSLEAFREYPNGISTCIIESVSRVAAFKSAEDFFDFKHPFLILAALISDVLSTNIFEDYFWIFRNTEYPDDDRLPANVLRDTFCRLCNSNSTNAHTWRALLFREVFPRAESSELNIWTEFSDDHSTRLIDFFMGTFRHGIASLFLRRMEASEAQKCDAQLQHLMSRAMKLFSRLQTQRADFIWSRPSDFLRVGFDVHSPKVAADRIVRLEDEDDMSRNGEKIKLVVSPAVQRFGDSYGENLETGRFLIKAVVFLEG